MLLDQDQIRADEALLQLGRRLRADGYRFTCVTPATQANAWLLFDSGKAKVSPETLGIARP